MLKTVLMHTHANHFPLWYCRSGTPRSPRIAKNCQEPSGTLAPVPRLPRLVFATLQISTFKFPSLLLNLQEKAKKPA